MLQEGLLMSKDGCSPPKKAQEIGVWNAPLLHKMSIGVCMDLGPGDFLMCVDYCGVP